VTGLLDVVEPDGTALGDVKEAFAAVFNDIRQGAHPRACRPTTHTLGFAQPVGGADRGTCRANKPLK
jgi:hypothetical protein